MKSIPTNRQASKDCQSVRSEITERVGAEILEKDFEPGTWAKALSISEGNMEEATMNYARLRVEELTQTHQRHEKKFQRLESRRLNSCLGISTVTELLERMDTGEVAEPVQPRFPFTWTLLLMVGLAGCVGAAGKLFSSSLPATMLDSMPLISIGSAFGLIVLLIITSSQLPHAIHRWFWSEGVVVACSAVCLLSTLLGVKVLLDNPYRPDVRVATTVTLPASGAELATQEDESDRLIVSMPIEN